MVTKDLTYEEQIAGKELDNQVLYFYDWDFQPLGQVEIDNLGLTGGHVLCGETEERLLLSCLQLGVPEYYIEKSDLGTGNIEIHPFTLPDLEWPDLEERS